MNIGQKMYELACELFPITRSITGNGVRKTLNILKREIPELNVYEVSSGTKCFDWTVPEEWNINDAYILDPIGNKICDFKSSNLHVVGYSTPIDKTVTLEELQNHLYSLPEQPDAIPYITSYYKKRWGFCLTHKQRETLKEGEYKVYIDSELKEGSLTYGEVILEGESKKEIFFSTYVCHPSMANNELSGPVVVTQLVKYIKSLEKRKYTYRIIFIPETIGSIVYLSKHYKAMQKNIIAGFNVSCVGDDNNYSYLPSRTGETLSDKVALHVLENKIKDYKKYSFLDRGSDERQYCCTNINLPICSVMRTKYTEYDEYHTSLDNLEYISHRGLEGAYLIHIKMIEILENNHIYQATTFCEPQLGKRGLYPTISDKDSNAKIKNMMNFWTYCDGEKDLIDIANIINVPAWELYDIADKFLSQNLIEKLNDKKSKPPK